MHLTQSSQWQLDRAETSHHSKLFWVLLRYSNGFAATELMSSSEALTIYTNAIELAITDNLYTCVEIWQAGKLAPVARYGER